MLRHRQTFGRPQIERKITIIRRRRRRRIIISAASFVVFTCPRNGRRVACLVFAPAVAQTLVRGISTNCACPPPLFLLFSSPFSSRIIPVFFLVWSESPSPLFHRVWRWAQVVQAIITIAADYELPQTTTMTKCNFFFFLTRSKRFFKLFQAQFTASGTILS